MNYGWVADSRQVVNERKNEKVKAGLYRYKKAVIKKEKGKMSFPADRASLGADKVKTGLYRYKKENHKCLS